MCVFVIFKMLFCYCFPVCCCRVYLDSWILLLCWYKCLSIAFCACIVLAFVLDGFAFCVLLLCVCCLLVFVAC